jgi:hypothetical protein
MRATAEERAIQAELRKIAKDVSAFERRLRPILKALLRRSKALPAYAEYMKTETENEDLHGWWVHCYVAGAFDDDLPALKKMVRLLREGAALKPTAKAKGDVV